MGALKARELASCSSISTDWLGFFISIIQGDKLTRLEDVEIPVDMLPSVSLYQLCSDDLNVKPCVLMQFVTTSVNL